MLATGGRRSTGLIREWKRECYPILVTDGSRNVTFARCVFSQLDVLRSQVNLLTSRRSTSPCPLSVITYLASWSVMPILNRSRRGAAQFRSSNSHQFENLVGRACGECVERNSTAIRSPTMARTTVRDRVTRLSCRDNVDVEALVTRYCKAIPHVYLIIPEHTHLSASHQSPEEIESANNECGDRLTPISARTRPLTNRRKRDICSFCILGCCLHE